MAKYRVNRYRTGYSSDEVTVEAKNEAEAVQKADNSDFDSSENDADVKDYTLFVTVLEKKEKY